MTELKAVIISGFPGVGKSYAVNYLAQNGLKVSDSDSSIFSWLYDDEGNKTDIRNPNFVDDYHNHIIEAATMNDIVFVSTHKDIRAKLKEENIKFYTFVPKPELKEEYLMRYVDRGSPPGLIRGVIDNWDTLITDVRDTGYPRLTVHLDKGEFLLNGLAFDPLKELADAKSPGGRDIGKSCAKEIIEFALDKGDFETQFTLAQSIRKYGTSGLEYIPYEEGEEVFEEIEDTSRWSIHGRRVYKRTRKDGSEVFIKEAFTEGATEYQEDDPSEFTIVKPYTETITRIVYK